MSRLSRGASTTWTMPVRFLPKAAWTWTPSRRWSRIGSSARSFARPGRRQRAAAVRAAANELATLPPCVAHFLQVAGAMPEDTEGREDLDQVLSDAMRRADRAEGRLAVAETLIMRAERLIKEAIALILERRTSGKPPTVH